MAKPRKQEKEAKSEPKSPKVLGCSALYSVKKFGLYAYQVFSVNPETGEETKLGVENVYGIVASELVDQIFHDINPGHK